MSRRSARLRERVRVEERVGRKGCGPLSSGHGVGRSVLGGWRQTDGVD